MFCKRLLIKFYKIKSKKINFKKVLHIYLSFVDISECLLRRYVSKIFSRFETFLQSNSVATSKLLILLHLVFSTIRLIFYTQVFIQNY